MKNKENLYYTIKGICGMLLLCLIVFGSRIYDGLTPVDVLTIKIYNKSRYKFDGSICWDGKISHSQGQGTCSWHGGIKHQFKKGEASKTYSKCKEEAKKLSWRDNFSNKKEHSTSNSHRKTNVRDSDCYFTVLEKEFYDKKYIYKGIVIESYSKELNLVEIQSLSQNTINIKYEKCEGILSKMRTNTNKYSF